MWFSAAHFAPTLSERQRQNAWRTPQPWCEAQATTITYQGKRLLNFASNDYLGLAHHPDIKQAAIKALRVAGVGSTSAALVCGQSHYHAALEERLATFMGKPKALLFSSGYTANLAVLSTLLNAKHALFQDRLNHASLLEGGLHSGAYFRRYRHGDMAHLEQLLKRQEKPTLVATDGVFSMDGDIAPLPALLQLCQQYNALLYVDDAHGFGVLGAQGRGIAEHFGVPFASLPLTMVTLGKALGVSGAAVVGDEHLIDYLQQFAKPYIFTTAMSPVMAAAALRALELIQEEPWRREKATTLARYFHQEAVRMGYTMAPSNTPIQPLIVGTNGAALHLSHWLFERGVLATAIRPPTVPLGTARLRFTITAAHSRAEVDTLLALLAQAAATQGVAKAR